MGQMGNGRKSEYKNSTTLLLTIELMTIWHLGIIFIINYKKVTK